MIDFLSVPGFLPPPACHDMAGVYRANAPLYQNNHADAFWNDRLLGLREVQACDNYAAAMLRLVVRRAVDLIRQFYRVQRPLYPDVVSLVGWKPGQSMPLHADNAYASGAPHALAHRAYSGMVYLTDDYEGGQLGLPRQNMLLRPSMGTLLSLPAGLSHEHRVLEVTAGLRVVLTFFLTADPSRVPVELKEFL